MSCCFCHIGDASLEQDMLTLDVEFIGESGCSTVVSNVVM